jgi:hypothetical protein
MRDEHYVAGAWDFDREAMSSRGIKPFEVGVDNSIRPGDDHRTRFFSPCRPGDDKLEIHSCVEYLGVGHKGGQLNRQIGCKEKRKLRGVEKSDSVGLAGGMYLSPPSSRKSSSAGETPAPGF